MTKDSAKSREWEFFRDERGRIDYNAKCEDCTKECKQSFRAVLVHCPIFQKRERPFNVRIPHDNTQQKH